MYHLSLQPDFRPSVFMGKFHFISLKNLLFSRLEIFTHHRKCCFEWLLSDYLILLWIQTDYICLLWMTTVFSIAENTEIADVWETQPVQLKLKVLWGWERRCFFLPGFYSTNTDRFQDHFDTSSLLAHAHKDLDIYLKFCIWDYSLAVGLNSHL